MTKEQEFSKENLKGTLCRYADDYGRWMTVRKVGSEINLQIGEDSVNSIQLPEATLMEMLGRVR